MIVVTVDNHVDESLVSFTNIGGGRLITDRCEPPNLGNQRVEVARKAKGCEAAITLLKPGESKKFNLDPGTESITIRETVAPMDFHGALIALKEGKRVRRKSWEKRITAVYLDIHECLCYSTAPGDMTRAPLYFSLTGKDLTAEDWEIIE